MVWGYTPRQAVAFVMIEDKRQRAERARNLEMIATAFRAEAKDINRRLRKDWNEE